MPSIAAYTPYETLKFCQSIAQHGTDNAAFEDIAAALNANDLIRDANSYDATRLTADALHGLYDDLLRQEKEEKSPKVNGNVAVEKPNPKKRKLSSSPAPTDQTESAEEEMILALVEKLYARFREEAIKAIKQDEAEYAKLESDIKELEEHEGSQQTPPVDMIKPAPPPHRRQGSKTDISALLTTDDEHATIRPSQEERLRDQSGHLPPQQQNEVHQVTQPPAHTSTIPSHPSPIPAGASPRPLEAPQPHAQNLQPQPQPQHQSPGAFHRQLPPPSPHRSHFSPTHPPQHGFQPAPPGPSASILPPPTAPPNMAPQHMPPPLEPPNPKRSSVSTSARNSPVAHQHQYPQPYPGYPPYPQPRPQHWQPHQYQQPPFPPQRMPYPLQSYYPPQQQNRQAPLYHTPSPQANYPPYLQATPVSYPGQPHHSWQPSPHHLYSQSTSATSTPVRALQTPAIARSGSSTPWKRRQNQPGHLRPPSPERPQEGRGVSPLSDAENDSVISPPPAVPLDPEPRYSSRSTRARSRLPSVTPPLSAAPASPTRSITSRKSETPSERRSSRVRSGVATRIKTETSGTPAPLSAEMGRDRDRDVSASGIGSARRRRGNRAYTDATNSNLVGSSQSDLSRTGTSKRKRDAEQKSVSPSLPRLEFDRQETNRPGVFEHDPSLVLVSKNFAKTTQMLMQEIMAHKLGGLFSKPVSERDAPGYKDLVLRPQDLRSIKTAIGKGSKAAIAAIEALEVEGTGPSKDGAEGEVGNGIWLVKKSEDLTPPKGIVNAGQLEMELVRVFANAVMFNPLPSSERGFGRNLRLRRDGGDIRQLHNVRADVAGEESVASESDEASSEGIIADVREMFEDAIEKIGEWRRVEGERMKKKEELTDILVRGSSVEVAESSEVGDGDHIERRKRRRVGE